MHSVGRPRYDKCRSDSLEADIQQIYALTDPCRFSVLQGSVKALKISDKF